VPLKRERVELPDGDFVDLDWAELTPPDTPLVLVLHGLEGWARSNYMLEMYRALGRRGVAAVGLNFRGCSGEPNRLPPMYHSGETGDLRAVLERLAGRFPSRALGAAGFSLGGNVLLKYLGEQGADAAHTPVAAAAAMSVPFDLSAGADWIERGASAAYRRYLVRKLHRKVRRKSELLRPHVDVEALLGSRTFREFDGIGTAPLHGFEDAEDYYRRSSCGCYIPAIRVPTRVIHAEDDPFLPPASIPRAALEDNRFIDCCITRRGGHVGFVAGPPWAPVYWAEEAAADFLARNLGGGRSRPAD